MSPPFKPLYERYEVKPDGCWEWTSTKAQGYGTFKVRDRRFIAHRYFFEWFNCVRIPQDMVIDHLCRNRACVNPNHLEVVTPGVNARRGLFKTECKRGHPRTGDNVRITPNGTRVCRECERLHKRTHRALYGR